MPIISRLFYSFVISCLIFDKFELEINLILNFKSKRVLLQQKNRTQLCLTWINRAIEFPKFSPRTGAHKLCENWLRWVAGIKIAKVVVFLYGKLFIDQ